jgi:hypothetical protein
MEDRSLGPLWRIGAQVHSYWVFMVILLMYHGLSSSRDDPLPFNNWETTQFPRELRSTCSRCIRTWTFTQAWAHHGPIAAGPTLGPFGVIREGPSLGPSWTYRGAPAWGHHGPIVAQAWAHHWPMGSPSVGPSSALASAHYGRYWPVIEIQVGQSA